MPYENNESLPEKVKSHLPPHAQDIYREAFNHSWKQYESPSKRASKDSREVVAHKVAWAAVEKKYHKNQQGKWVSNTNSKD